MRPVGFPLGLGLALVGAGGCADPTNRFVERSDSAGVHIVLNTGDTRTLAWAFEERLRVDAAEPNGGGFLQLGPGVAGADSSGNIYVLDRARARVVVFDSAGRGTRTLGIGEPGATSLEAPVAISVSRDGSVWVHDAGKSSLVHFGPDGAIRGERPLERGRWEWRVQVAGERMVGVLRASPADSSSARRRLVMLAGNDTLPLATRPNLARDYTLPGCGVAVRAEPLFAAPIVWDVRDSIAAVTTDAGYLVDWFVAGARRRSVRRQVDVRPVTEELAYRQLAGGTAIRTTDGRCQADSVGELARRGYEPTIPAVHAIALAPDGGLWITRGHVRGEDPAVDVFAPSGAYLGRLAAGAPVPIGFTPSGEVLAAEPRAGRQALIVYRVRRGR